MSINSIGVYCRLSRDDNKENYDSIETQRDICVSFIETNNLGTIYDVYIDDNISGTTFEREELKRLSEDVQTGKINLIVTKDLSRIGRNNAKTLIFLDFLEEFNANLIAISDNYDTSKDDDDIIGIKTWYNERYAKDISKKIRSSLKQKMKNGEFIGSAPFGYKKINETNKLVVDEKVRHIIEEIYKLYIQGYGYKKIAEILQEKSYPSPAEYKNYLIQSDVWEHYQVKRIINNRVYCGDIIQGVREVISFKNKKTRKKPEKEWIIIEDAHEAIISKATWELANNIRKKKGTGEGRYKKQLYLFSGFLECGLCGKSLVARKVKNKPLTFICSRYMKYGTKGNGCKSHSIRDDELRKILLENLYEMSSRLKESIINKTLNKEFEYNNLKSRIKELEKRVKENERKIDILYEDRLNGNLSIEMFKNKSNQFSRENVAWKQQIKCMNNKLDFLNEKYRQVDMISCIFEELFNEETLLSRGNMQKLVKKIYVFLPGEVSEDFKAENNIDGEKYSKLKNEGGMWIKYNFTLPDIE